MRKARPVWLKSRMFIRIPLQQNLKHIQIHKTRLEDGQGIFPNTFGKSFYYGDLDVCQLETFLRLCRENWI